MELQEIMQSFLPREVIEVFDIQKIKDNAVKERLDIYLDERRVIPAQRHFALNSVASGTHFLHFQTR